MTRPELAEPGDHPTSWQLIDGWLRDSAIRRFALVALTTVMATVVLVAAVAGTSLVLFGLLAGPALYPILLRRR